MIPGAAPARESVWIARTEKLFAIYAILFMTGGLTRLLTGGLPEEVAREVSSPLVQFSGLGIYAVTLALLALRLQRFLPLLPANALLFAPVLFALLSTYWSVDPDLTLRRSVSLVGTTVLGFYLGARFDLREVAWLFFVALSIIVLGSVAVAVALPGFGVHQASDALTAHHAGLWRGLYWHKNSLGPVASVLSLLTIALWRQIGFPAAVKLGVIAACAAVVLKSGSSQALFQFCVFTTLLLAHRLFSRLGAGARASLVAVALPVGMVALLNFDAIQSVALDLLGRDPTLSSRIYIWHAAILGGLRHPMLGGGYDAGWGGPADLYAQQLYYITVGHAHNGYLQLWLDVGFVGAGLLASVWVVYLVRTFAVARVSYDIYILMLYVIINYFISNYITTFLMKYQDIYWVMLSTLLVMASRLLRESPRSGPVRPPRAVPWPVPAATA